MSVRCWMLLSVIAIILSGCGGGSWVVEPPPVAGNDPAIRINAVWWQENGYNNIISIKASGQVYNINPNDYKVSAWIGVGGSWWPKPTLAKPYTSIGSSGKWTTGNLVTGGRDQTAYAVKVYLVKKTSTWKPGTNSCPPGDIVAEDTVFKKTDGIDSKGVLHQTVILSDKETREMQLELTIDEPTPIQPP